jgi:hypothetical protein
MFKELQKAVQAPTPNEQVFAVRQRFWELIKTTQLARWRKGDTVATAPRWLLVGLALYSIYDLELADMLAARLETGPHNLAIAVFDLLDVTDIDDFQSYIPGIARVWDGPVAGFWIDGRLVETGQARDGRDLAERVIGKPESES